MLIEDSVAKMIKHFEADDCRRDEGCVLVVLTLHRVGLIPLDELGELEEQERTDHARELE